MKLKLASKTPLVGNITTFKFDSDQPISWTPGQYMHYVLPHANADDRGEERWFTISAPPYEGHITITTRHSAPHGSTFKASLFAMEPGDTIESDGPEGDFVVEDPNRHMVFIAGGIGITPFHSILKQLDHDGIDMKVELLYANRDDDYAFLDELNDIQRRRKNFCMHLFTGDRKIEDEELHGCHDNDPDTLYYVSGPYPMVDNFKDRLLAVGIPEKNIMTDDFPGYELND